MSGRCPPFSLTNGAIGTAWKVVAEGNTAHLNRLEKGDYFPPEGDIVELMVANCSRKLRVVVDISLKPFLMVSSKKDESRSCFTPSHKAICKDSQSVITRFNVFRNSAAFCTALSSVIGR